MELMLLEVCFKMLTWAAYRHSDFNDYLQCAYSSEEVPADVWVFNQLGSLCTPSPHLGWDAAN